MSNTDLDTTKKQALTGVNKYYKCVSQVEIELD